VLGPYTAKEDGKIAYKGNKVFAPIDDISAAEFGKGGNERAKHLKEDQMWSRISRINHSIFQSTADFFAKKKALFTALPLTTRMISSPGAFYGREAISYTTDTCPITLNWFDLPDKAFLSESSQIYLELALMQERTNQVFSIYNSFRKEKADATHLSEFHHIEYEGKVSQVENEDTSLDLIGKIIKDLLKKNKEDLAYFLDETKLRELRRLADRIRDIPRITFREALDVLYKHTKNPNYKDFTAKHFGAWEEVKLTEIFGTMLLIKEYPLLEVPFYHARVDGKEPKVANNADIIWPGYREILGSGHRVRSTAELEEKARIFQLPRDDYGPYLQTRALPGYTPTSGFGLGWERILHGILEMPFIWSAAHFPRVHSTLKP
jgi:aspartyl/asparaginyl-tRNA synthetase